MPDVIALAAADGSGSADVSVENTTEKMGDGAVLHSTLVRLLATRPAAASPPAVPTDPAGLTGRAFDLLAGTGTTFTDAGVTPATAGASVQRWTDSSGNARHVNQTTLARKPTLQQVGGDYWLLFDGTDDRLTFGSAVSLTDHTLYAVWRMDDSRAAWSSGRILLGQANGTDGIAFNLSDVGTQYQSAGEGIQFSDAASNAAKVVQAIRRSGATVEVWTGGTKAAETGTLSAPASPLVVQEVSGMFQNTSLLLPWKGYVRRLIAFGTVHDEATIQGVSAWLAAN